MRARRWQDERGNPFRVRGVTSALQTTTVTDIVINGA